MSRFRPRAQHNSPSEAPNVEAARRLDDAARLHASSCAEERPQARPEAGLARQRRVLVVDDQQDMLSMMKLMLSRHGYEVMTASSASQAVQLALDFQPALVISDIGMPGMDGCAMMRALRVEKHLSPFKAIALTGFGLPADQKCARDAGFDLCLIKPIDFETFFDRIEEMTRQLSREMADDIAAASCLDAASGPRATFDAGLEGSPIASLQQSGAAGH